MSKKTITNREDIKRIKEYFINQNNFAYDRHLLYFTLGINTPLKPDELSKIKWSDLIFNNHVQDFLEYNGYKFYLNNSCKRVIIQYIRRYVDIINNEFVFEGIGHNQNNMTYAATNKMYRIIKDTLNLDFEFSNLSLHKTFVYWQIYYCNSDYVKMTKLYYLTARNTEHRRNKDINSYAEYDINDNMIYINDVNL